MTLGGLRKNLIGLSRGDQCDQEEVAADFDRRRK